MRYTEAYLPPVMLLTICLAGCSAESAEDASTSGVPGAPSPPAAAPPPMTSGDVPPDVLVRRGACPFECCVYGQWTAETPVAVMAREREATSEPVFTIAAGQAFKADSGNVHITEVARVEVTDSVADGAYWSFAPGDTLAVLDHVGEGHYNVYFQGRVQEVEGFWARQPPVARLLGQPRSEWWVHVTAADGRQGWVLMNDEVDVRGADACA